MAATYTHPILKHSVLPKNIIMVGGLSQSFTYLYRLPLDGKTFTLNSRIQTSIQFHCYDNLMARRPLCTTSENLHNLSLCLSSNAASLIVQLQSCLANAALFLTHPLQIRPNTADIAVICATHFSDNYHRW